MESIYVYACVGVGVGWSGPVNTLIIFICVKEHHSKVVLFIIKSQHFKIFSTKISVIAFKTF